MAQKLPGTVIRKREKKTQRGREKWRGRERERERRKEKTFPRKELSSGSICFV